MYRKMNCLIYFILVLSLVLTNAANAQDPNLVGWWKFDEALGDIAVDSASGDNNGTVIGDTWWVVDGKVGGALYLNDFNDTNCRVEIPYGWYVGCNGDFWVLIDGQVRESHRNVTQKNVLNNVSIRLNPSDHFLTLVTTDGGDVDRQGAYQRSYTCDWCVFVEPALVLETGEG